MTVETSQEKIDWDRVFKTYELPHWARVQVHFRREELWKEPVEWDCIAVFDYMDWMYWRRHSEEDDEILIFNWNFKQVDEKNFTLIPVE